MRFTLNSPLDFEGHLGFRFHVNLLLAVAPAGADSAVLLSMADTVDNGSGLPNSFQKFVRR
eukprot:321116-Rhodomonas_salina.1